MQQRVALCRAIIHEPSILLMDEPFGALDELTRLEMNDLLLDIRRVTGATVVFVTHSISEAIYLSDQVVVFSKRPAVIVKELTIDIPYPRSQDAFPTTVHRMGTASRRCARFGAPMSRNIARLFYPVAGAAIIVLIWHFYVVLMQVPIVVLPTPLQVLKSMTDDAKILTEEGWVTALECIYGFALSLAIGIPIAVVMTYSRIANQMFYPLLVASQSIPKVAVAPILLVWFGTGIKSKLAMAFVIAFFPVVVDTATGLRSTSPDLLELARSLQCTRLQTFLKIQLPSALPSIFSGAKIAVTLSVIGAVIGEFIGSNEGLGNLLLTANSQLNSPLVWASLTVLSVLGMILYGLVVLAEKLLMPWATDDDLKH